MTPLKTGMDYSTAIELFTKQVNKALGLISNRSLLEETFHNWERETRDTLQEVFGGYSSEEAEVFRDFTGGAIFGNESPEQWQSYWWNELARQMVILTALLGSLQAYQEVDLGQSVRAVRALNNRVFLVHGHNEAALYKVERILKSQHLETIILQEEPNRGQTIIEKFEAHGDVGFAVVLLTGDDHGGPPRSSLDSLHPRARQNVIFELGYFIGRLGRKRVCALYEEGVEIPSDYSGVLYIALDPAGGWKLRLGMELRAAGFDIDLNRTK